MSTFWSLYVTVLTLGTIFAMAWLLFATRKGQRVETTDETVGHAFDGIEEYDNPLPKWWFLLFVATLQLGWWQWERGLRRVGYQRSFVQPFQQPFGPYR